MRALARRLARHIATGPRSHAAPEALTAAGVASEPAPLARQIVALRRNDNRDHSASLVRGFRTSHPGKGAWWLNARGAGDVFVHPAIGRKDERGRTDRTSRG